MKKILWLGLVFMAWACTAGAQEQTAAAGGKIFQIGVPDGEVLLQAMEVASEAVLVVLHLDPSV